jgi:hypothetical protein
MDDVPRVRFLSLFVPDLDAAAARYAAVLGVAPRTDAGVAPARHPFAAAGPVVFDLGGVALALYRADGRGTHAGDVGIGLEAQGAPESVTARAAAEGGRVVRTVERLGPTDARAMSILALPDRHFFEIVSPAAR